MRVLSVCVLALLLSGVASAQETLSVPGAGGTVTGEANAIRFSGSGDTGRLLMVSSDYKMVTFDEAAKGDVSVCAGGGKCLTLAALRGFATTDGELSEAERSKLENLQLQSQLAQLLAQKSDCEAQLGPLRAQAHNQALTAQATALKEQIEQAHPGYTFDVQTGKLTKKPAEQKPEE